MSGRVSRMIRRARSAARRRGIPFDRVLPYAEVALGALLGLICGALVWGAVTAWFVNQSAEQALEVSAGGGRDAEAARRVANEVTDRAFQKDWHVLDAREAGLGGACRLRAETATVGDRDAVRHVVILHCQGRPGLAVAKALAGANRRALALEGRLTLQPPGYEAEHSRLLRKKAGLVKDLAEIDAKQAALDARRAPQPAGERLAAELKLAKADHLTAQQRLREAQARAQEPSMRLAALERELASLEAVKTLSPAEVAGQSQERTDIERRLQGVSREDCTPEHPLVRRLKEIDRQLRRTDLPREIAEVRSGLPDIEALSDDEERTRLRVSEIEAKLSGKGGSGVESQDPEAQGIKRQKAAKDGDLAGVEEKLTALEAAPKTRIAIRPAGRAIVHPPAGGALVLLLAVALGVGLALLFHFKVAPGFSLIDDQDSLAERLQVAVLGVVPRLAALERR